MTDWFASGGIMMWPILGAGLASAGLALDAGRKLAAGTAEPPKLGVEIDAVLFWGAFASLLGLIGTTVGVAQTARYLEEAGRAPAAVAWSGIRVALVTTVFGLAVLALSLVAWFGLRALLRRATSS